MTQEDNDLLLRDLSGRLPYWVICDIGGGKEHTLLSIHISRITEILCEFHDMEDTYQVPLANVKPYLRQMSTMTEEEKRELQSFFPGSFGGQWLNLEKGYIDIYECESTTRLYLYDSIRLIEWLNKKMFDYRRLIDKGLAIEVTEDNNPYKD